MNYYKYLFITAMVVNVLLATSIPFIQAKSFVEGKFEGCVGVTDSMNSNINDPNGLHCARKNGVTYLYIGNNKSVGVDLNGNRITN